MKTSPRMSRPQSSAHFSPFFFFLFFFFIVALPEKSFFSSFLLSCWSFLQVLLQRLRTVDHFLILLLLPHEASATGSQCLTSDRAATGAKHHVKKQTNKKKLFHRCNQNYITILHLKVSLLLSSHLQGDTIAHAHYTSPTTHTYCTHSHTHIHTPVPVPQNSPPKQGILLGACQQYSVYRNSLPKTSRDCGWVCVRISVQTTTHMAVTYPG